MLGACTVDVQGIQTGGRHDPTHHGATLQAPLDGDTVSLCTAYGQKRGVNELNTRRGGCFVGLGNGAARCLFQLREFLAQLIRFLAQALHHFLLPTQGLLAFLELQLQCRYTLATLAALRFLRL